MESFPLKEETRRIIGACYQVYNQMGCGFTEPIYQECLEMEFRIQGIPFVSRPTARLEYKGQALQHKFQPDFICFGRVVVELKSLAQLIDENRAQLLNYLHAISLEIGLLINFGHHPGLEFQRFANSRRMPLTGDGKSWGIGESESKKYGFS